MAVISITLDVKEGKIPLVDVYYLCDKHNLLLLSTET